MITMTTNTTTTETTAGITMVMRSVDEVVTGDVEKV